MLIQDDSLLKYYVCFEQSGKVCHREEGDNCYYMTEKADKDLTDRETFLLMLAEVTHDARYYFVFTTNSKCNDCWTYPHDNNPMTDDGNLLQDHGFHGGQEQQFEFRDNGNGTCCIISRKTNQALYRSGNKYKGQGHPLRLSTSDDCGKSDHVFKIKMRTDKPVYMPATLGPQHTGQLYSTTLLGYPPVPTCLNDLPAPPQKVLIGETLLPFFNVKHDDDFSGSNLMDWQVNNRPYYRFRREQQQQARLCVNIAQGPSQRKTISYECGVSMSESSSIETHTGFSFDYSSTHTASIGITKNIKAEASKGFNAQWERDVTVTLSEEITQSINITVEEVLNFPETAGGITWIRWLAVDIWTIYYDDYKAGANDDSSSHSWIAWSGVETSSSYPSDAVVTKVK